VNIKKVLVSLLFTVATTLNAQVLVTGEFTSRTEYTKGYKKLVKGSDDYGLSTSARAALNLSYKTSSYSTYLSLQEVFTMGDRTQLSPKSNGNLRVQEAWVNVGLSENLSLKLGRQGIAYDDQRIMGTVAWAMQKRTHDAAIFKYHADDLSLDLGLAYNQEKFSLTGNDYFSAGNFSYKTMQYVHAKKSSEKGNLSVFFLNNGFQTAGTEVFNLLTVGIHAGLKIRSVLFDANAFVQGGERIGGEKISGAYLLSLDATCKADQRMIYGFGGSVISGKTDHSAAFFPLYGTNHKFNGFMDYFYVGQPVNSVGLIDLHVSTKVKLGKGYGMFVKVMNFQVEQALPSGETSLGTEVDLVLSKKFDGFVVKAGYSQMFASDGMYELQGVSESESSDTQNWAWMMLVFKPKFVQ